MKIIPLSELRNTSAVSKLVTDAGEPVFVTKQGGEHIVMLSHELFEDMSKENKELKLYVKVLSAEIEQLKNGGQSRPFDEFMKELKNEN